MSRIRVAVAGIGNCASALVQGVAYYGDRPAEDGAGLMHARIGPWEVGDLEFVAAFDVDRRKVGRPLEEAIFAPPNCARVFQPHLPSGGPIVCMGPVLDGVAPHMHGDDGFHVADVPAVDVARVLRDTGAEVLVVYLPVGSDQAVQAYAAACLEARVALVNCVPVFIASDPAWARRFEEAGVPVVGDDIKSQVGATILHRVLARLFRDRGVDLRRTYQVNTGGNTDFRNMLERGRLSSKKRSKTEAVQAELAHPLPPRDIHVGPSDFIPWQEDNKVAFIRLEGEGFGGQAIDVEIRLSVQDSPNSAGVVVDAVRCARLALDRGLGGPLEAVCAWTMKSPPRQLTDTLARERLEAFLREPAEVTP